MWMHALIQTPGKVAETLDGSGFPLLASWDLHSVAGISIPEGMLYGFCTVFTDFSLSSTVYSVCTSSASYNYAIYMSVQTAAIIKLKPSTFAGITNSLFC